MLNNLIKRFVDFVRTKVESNNHKDRISIKNRSLFSGISLVISSIVLIVSLIGLPYAIYNLAVIIKFYNTNDVIGFLENSGIDAEFAELLSMQYTFDLSFSVWLQAIVLLMNLNTIFIAPIYIIYSKYFDITFWNFIKFILLAIAILIISFIVGAILSIVLGNRIVVKIMTFLLGCAIVLYLSLVIYPTKFLRIYYDASIESK